jgi:ABC-type multidrug transport system permease subunit
MSPKPNRLRYSAIVQLVLARVREFYRQPEAIFWVYGFPLIMVVALGIAFRQQPVEQVRVDIHKGPQAQQVLDALAKHEKFVTSIAEEEACQRRLRTGKTDVVISAESDFYQFFYDPGKPGSVLARNELNDALQRFAGRSDPIQTSDVEMTEPGGRYIDFLVPGLLGMSLMSGGLWGVGFVIVDMRMRKMLKRFMATPMKRSHFLASLMISRLFFLVPEVLLLLIFSRYVFGVVNYGSITLLIFLILLGSVMFNGIGLLVASRAQTLETISGLMNVVMLPMWILSGIFFSVDRFPEAAQPFIRLIPLTPVIDSLRSVMLEGATLTSLGPEIGYMMICGGVCFAAALKVFRWN